MNRAEITKKVLDIVKENLDSTASHINLGDRFRENLNADDLDMVKFGMELEEHFGIEIPDEDAGKFVIVNDVVMYIERKLKGDESQPVEKIFRIKGFYSCDYLTSENIKKLIDHAYDDSCEVEVLGVSDLGKICKHCGYPIALRNPSGHCDHLYYPEYCKVCKASLKPKASDLPGEIDPTGHEVDGLYMKIILAINRILNYLKKRDKR